MAGSLSFDDKLLGEKTHYYCSSSESEDEGDGEGRGDGGDRKSSIRGPTFVPESEMSDYQGFSTNTGPKGVINDWRRYKQLETEKREEQAKERDELIKKLSVTCRSHLDDEAEKTKDQQLELELEELSELDDAFIKQYQQKRLEEMRKALECVPKFGKVVSLTKDGFVDAIDAEKPQVTVIVHVYDDRVRACDAMNGCLTCLAREYPTVKFCKIRASEANVSAKFVENGVPALLVYKNKDIIGNLIRVSDELGDDFFATDLESFLQEHGFLPQKDLIPALIRTAAVSAKEDCNSDFELD